MSPTIGQQVDQPVAQVLDDPPVTSAIETRRGLWARLYGLTSGAVFQGVAVVLGLVGSVIVAVTALAAGPLDTDTSYQWWFSLPKTWLAQYPDGAPVANEPFYIGLGLVSFAWLVVGVGVKAGRWRIRQLWIVAAVWAVPLLIGPVALSTDVYTYLGQGLVLNAGFDPYTNGPTVAGLPDLLAHRIPGVWMDKPSPYGPAFTGIDSLIAPLARVNLTLAVIVLRLVTLSGLALAAVCLPRVARTAGGDPVLATWLGVTSPLALGAIVLSGHNDALMVGLVVAALALCTVRRPWAPIAAVAVASAAAMIKAPAVVAVAVIGLLWALQADRLRTVVARIGASAGVALGITVLVSLVTGLGTRWINMDAIASPKLAAPTFTPSHTMTATICDIAAEYGAFPDPATVLNYVEMAGMIVVAVLALALLPRLRTVGATRGIGILMAAVVLASPVTWPWYFTWPVLLLAAVTRSRKLRLTLVVFAGGSLFLTMADGSPHDFEQIGNYVVTGLVLLTMVLTGVWLVRHLYRTPTTAATTLPGHV